MYLIVNLGLKSIRAIIFNDKGQVIYSNSFPVHTSLKNDYVEQNVLEWKELFHKLLDDIQRTSDLLKKITYISSTTSSSCVFGFDENLNPITKVQMVSDKRGSLESEKIKNNKIYQNKNDEESIFCSISSNIPKLLWVQNNHPEIYKKINYWVGAGEFLNYMFTGELFTDPLNASKAFYSENINDYHKDVLNDLSLSPDILPPVLQIGTQFAVSDLLIEKYALNPNCRYVLTTYDAICAVIGSNTGEEGNVCDVSGTITSVRVLTDIDKKISNKESTILKQNIPLLNKSIIGSSNNLGGGIIEWYKQAFFDDNREDVYSQMENEATLSQPGSKGILFLPYLLGERSPFVNKNIRGTFFGIDRNATGIDFTRAVFESTAFVTNDLLALIRNENQKVNSLSVSGGLARFDIINQIKADVTNLPVHVIGNFESTAIGALILMRISLGHYKNVSEAATELVTVRKVILPNKFNVEIYEEAFGMYKKISENILKLSKDHSVFSKKLEMYSSKTVRNL